jgi:hypothetical protein
MLRRNRVTVTTSHSQGKFLVTLVYRRRKMIHFIWLSTQKYFMDEQ